MADSALALVRALKAPTDPPTPNGPVKIALASNAWTNSTLYMPNKAETIADWLLTRLLKDKDKDPASNPLLDSRHWKLLADILTSTSSPINSESTQSARTWLVPLLNRVPFAPVLIAMLNIGTTQALKIDTETMHNAILCSNSIWAMASPKFTLETLLDCFGSLLKYLGAGLHRIAADHDDVITPFTRLVSNICNTYRDVLQNSAHKKKAYSVFTASHMQPWLVAVYSKSGPPRSDPILSTIYQTGVDTLFSIDVLRAAQEDQSQPLPDDILSSFIAQDPSHVLTSLTDLFRAYIQSVNRHRGSLFGQSSKHAGATAVDQARATALKFYASCESLFHSMPETSAQVWRTRSLLLDVINQERLLNSTSEVSAATLRQVAESSVTSLSAFHQRKQHELTGLALDCLCILTDVDYELIPSPLERVLPVISMVQGLAEPGSAYLKRLLIFHSKTRTMDTFLLSALQSISFTAKAAQESYLLTCSSPLLSNAFLDRLSRATLASLTPGQVSEVAREVLEKLSEALETFQEQATRSSTIDESRKRRRRERRSPTFGITDPDHAAVRFAFMAKVACVVLASLPLHLTSDETQSEIRRAIQSFYACSILQNLLNTLKSVSIDSHADNWCHEIVATFLLRLRYTLLVCPQYSLLTENNGNLLSKLKDLLETESVIHELRVEIQRTLLHISSENSLDATSVIADILKRAHSIQSQELAAWDGKLHRLKGDDASSAAIASLHVLLDRWLPNLDKLASMEQLQQLSQIMLTALPYHTLSQSDASPANSISIPLAFVKLLRDAEFWELQNFREALVSQINEQTAPLGHVDVKDLFEQDGGSLRQNPAEFVGIYELLLYAPPEFFPRGVRTDLLRRAMVVDVTLGFSAKGRPLYPVERRHLLVVREFIRRVFAYVGGVEHAAISEYTSYLVEPPFSLLEEDVSKTTLNLFKMHIETMFASSLKGNADALSSLLRSFIQSRELSMSAAQTDHPGKFKLRCLALLLESLVAEISPSQLRGGEVLENLKNLHGCLYSTLHSRILVLVSVESPDLSQYCIYIDLWCAFLAFQRWLDVQGATIPLLGRPLVAKIMQSISNRVRILGEVLISTFAVLLEELAFNSDKKGHIEFVVASYLAFYKQCNASEREALNVRLETISKKLSLETFAVVLNIVSEGIGRSDLGAEHLNTLIRLSHSLIHNAPEGTLRLTQDHVTTCLMSFIDQPAHSTNTILLHQVLSFITTHINDRPAALRSSQVPPICSLIGRALAPSMTHDSQTCRGIFSEIVSALSGLVRLRRDLVLPILPLLCLTLRRLINCLKTVVPNLGARQKRLVSNTLPQWISTNDPLSSREARPLARLLTSLTTKTVIRTHSNVPALGLESQKADSLSRPLSKHIFVVLKTYIETLNDPLCVLSTDIRRELEPGLFALCEIIGEKYRDSLMVALDSGGKVVMKGLWKQYEKQRYVGKG
ncbi:hypothetical protein K474DRAFT_1586046 [Panus rudis PR-1116 ss-1]|nr:hypothetical protein K474DRAFT_1586046 [Panus rudis PR-1116 ss-1]